MEPLSVQEIREAVRGDFETLPTDDKVTGVSTDTRSIEPGDLFVALQGPSFDGHDFMPQAGQKGAVAIVCRKGAGADSSACCIGVKDTLQALGDLAASYRRRFATHVIGVTGSNGKTTTKEMIHHVLSAFHSAVKSEESFNNFVGLPLSIFKIDTRQKFAVLEMGTNAPGEISRLSKIACPNMAVLTCINEAHVEGLGDIEGVTRAKAEVTHGMGEDGVLVVNGDDPRCCEIAARYAGKTFRFGFGPDADVRCTGMERRGMRTAFLLADGAECDLPLLGKHNVMNALACMTICQYAGASRKDIAERLASFVPPKMRGSVFEADGLVLVNDSYNANPASFRAAIETLASIDAPRRVLVCGDMLELGERSGEFHLELGRQVARAGVGLIVCVGPAAATVGRAAVEEGVPGNCVHSFETSEDAAASIGELIGKGDAVLVKGSRAMRMDVIADRIRGRAEYGGREG